MPNPDLKNQIIENIYSADIPTTPIVENCKIRQITHSSVLADKTIKSVKYEINITTPYYLSLICDDENLKNVIDGLIWIKDNLPPVKK